MIEDRKDDNTRRVLCKRVNLSMRIYIDARKNAKWVKYEHLGRSSIAVNLI